MLTAAYLVPGLALVGIGLFFIVAASGPFAGGMILLGHGIIVAGILLTALVWFGMRWNQAGIDARRSTVRSVAPQTSSR